MTAQNQRSGKDQSVWIGIDILRGLLAILVLFAHSLKSMYDLSLGADAEQWDSVPAMIFRHGGYWVCGFFILSGFCIHKSIMGMQMRAMDFACRYSLARITRLYPMYGVAALVMGIAWVTMGAHDPNDFIIWREKLVGHVFMLQAFVGTFHELGPSWSITYEAIYYLVWPLLLAVCAWRGWLSFITGMVGALLLTAVAVVIWKKNGGDTDSPWLFVWLVPSQFVLWLGGAALAEYWRAILPKVKSWWMPVSLAGVLGGYVLIALLNYHGARQWMVIAASYLSLPFWLGLIVSFSLWEQAGRWAGFARTMGLLSYPLYIMHQVFLDILVRVLPVFGFWLNALLLAFFVLIVGFVLGVPLEARILQWRKGILDRVKGFYMPKRSATDGA